MAVVTDKLQRESLSRIPAHARSAYAQCVAGKQAAAPWWSAVIVTASSQPQANRYLEEITRRSQRGTIPAGVQYLVVPDLEGRRIGSGGATLNALRVLAEQSLTPRDTDLASWWAQQRVFIIHSGGDARRLPQYSLSGKLFSALPIKTPWGDVSTIFDEMLVLSTTWARRLSAGLVVASGDVLLTFDADALHWDRPGVTGVAIPDTPEVGAHHGVYVADEHGRVYAFYQKPSLAQVADAGGMLSENQMAVDTGLIRFDAPTATTLTELAGVSRAGDRWQIDRGILAGAEDELPNIDLYEQMTLSLTGQWAPSPVDPPCLHRLSAALRGVPFWCDVVTGEFTDVGTTTFFRRLMTSETPFSERYEAQHRLPAIKLPGVRSAGVIVDSVLAGGGDLGADALVIECDLNVPVHAGVGAILHGLTELTSAIDVPDNTVVHQVPITGSAGERGTVIRAYGVDDNPKLSVTTGAATWFGRPILEVFRTLGIRPELVWPDLPVEECTLWNALLFPLTTPDTAWQYAGWMLGLYTGVSADAWAALPRFSLATSAQCADAQALADAHTRRLQETWRITALSLALAGSDLTPLLAYTPGVTTLSATARALWSQAALKRLSAPTEAASLYFQANRFFSQAGLSEDAEQARAMAFGCVQHGVEMNVQESPLLAVPRRWQASEVMVSAPGRIDFGGGWSDTPPFCQDWGGTVLNMAISLNGAYPITTSIRRLEEPICRCVSVGSRESIEYRQAEEILAPLRPGSPYSISRAALQLIGLVRPGETLPEALADYGGGLEIRTNVQLPVGSGLGVSSILAATVMHALAAMLGVKLTDVQLSELVLQLEQCMATGGGWQDQVGGIFPGCKLITTGPGLRQRLRVFPLAWAEEQQREFADRFILYYTGIRRIAKDLLAQVVGSYLSRESATIQVLHSIKTLAMEMNYAMIDGEWGYLGDLLDRHWQLNLQLDPHTTNAPINSLLQDVRPYLAGAKLAGAGGGGFIMMLAKSPETAQALRSHLSRGGYPGTIYECAMAVDGLQVEVRP